MNMKMIAVGTAAMLSVISVTSFSLNLKQCYALALEHDPNYLKTVASNLSLDQQRAIDRAALLPNITANGEASTNILNNMNNNTHNNTATISVNQSVFNLAKWINYHRDFFTNKANADMTAAALQDLMVRTTSAYFAVSSAQEALYLAKQELKQNQQLLKLTKTFYKAGQKTDLDVSSATSSLATSQAEVITDQQALIKAQSELGQITQNMNIKTQGLYQSLPLTFPNPQKLSTWLQKTDAKNLTIQADHNNLLAAAQNIKVSKADHLPTLGGQFSYGYIENNYGAAGNNSETGGSASLSMNLPLYQGGRVMASTKQAEYNYQAQSQQQALDRASFLAQTQVSYYLLVNSIKKIDADFVAIKAAQRSWHDAKVEYRAGQINYMDLSRTEENLYTAKIQYINDKYAYVNSIFSLKQAAGTLSFADINKVNSWL